MAYSDFSVSPLATLAAIAMGVVLGVGTVVLARRRKRIAALAMGISSVLLVTAWVLVNGMLETAGTNQILSVANDIAVPAGFEPGTAENHREGRTVRAAGFMPCGAVTAPCPYINRQWSAPRTLKTNREDFERTIRNSGWQDGLVIEEPSCKFVYTNSNYIGCRASGVVDGYQTTLWISQGRGDVWWLGLSMELPRSSR